MERGKHMGLTDVIEGISLIVIMVLVTKMALINLHSDKEIVAFAGENNTLVFQSGKTVKVKNNEEFLHGEEVFVKENQFVAHKMYILPLESHEIIQDSLASL